MIKDGVDGLMALALLPSHSKIIPERPHGPWDGLGASNPACSNCPNDDPMRSAKENQEANMALRAVRFVYKSRALELDHLLFTTPMFLRSTPKRNGR